MNDVPLSAGTTSMPVVDSYVFANNRGGTQYSHRCLGTRSGKELPSVTKPFSLCLQGSGSLS